MFVPVYGDDVRALAGFTTDHGRKTTVVINDNEFHFVPVVVNRVL